MEQKRWLRAQTEDCHNDAFDTGSPPFERTALETAPTRTASKGRRGQEVYT